MLSEKKLVDRAAILMVAHWARNDLMLNDDRDLFQPFADDWFWHGAVANEIRRRPEYQKAVQTIEEWE